MKSFYQGSLLGLACGDALGTTLEFYRPGYFEPIDDMIGGGFFNLQPGTWTDDTSLALCLAQSLIDKQDFDAQDQMNKYLDWYENGYFSATGECFDIGMSTRQALEEFKATNNQFAGDLYPDAAGNGALMRLAPIALAYRGSEKLSVNAARSSRTTHGSKQSIECCQFYAWLIEQFLRAEPDEKEKIFEISREYPLYHKPLHPDVEPVIEGSYTVKQPPEIKGAGYVPVSMEAALWAVYNNDNYRDTVLAATNLGDDAAT